MFLLGPVKNGCLDKFLLISNYTLPSMFTYLLISPSQANKESCRFLFAGCVLYFCQYLETLL